MRWFTLSALLCALTIGFASMSINTASAAKKSARAGCHVHGTLLCCPGGCIDPKRKSRRPVTRAGCHWHGGWVCCPGLGCINPTQVRR